MTQITVTNAQPTIQLVKITEAEVGKWYKIYYYPYGTQYNGEIGVLIDTWPSYSTEKPVKQLVGSDGLTYSNQEFILQELTEVQITYK